LNWPLDRWPCHRVASPRRLLSIRQVSFRERASRKGTTMKTALALTVAAAALLVSASAKAQVGDTDYPVCQQVYSIGGGYTTCSFTSLEQCKLSASGRAAQCFVNPFYAHGAPPVRKPRHRAPPYERDR
jgi:hypothetical protein